MTVVAILLANQFASAGSALRAREPVQTSYLRVLGLQSMVNQGEEGVSSAGFAMPTVTQADEEKILTMSKDPLIYNKISKSIASAIYG